MMMWKPVCMVLLLAASAAARPEYTSPNKEELPCDVNHCKEGETCYLQEEECDDHPCALSPVCRQNNCANILCITGTTCVNGKCIPNHNTTPSSCEGFPCKPPYECYLKKGECEDHQLCPPRPTCRLDKCAVVRCMVNTTCIDGKCIQNHNTKPPSCDGFKCGPGEKCYLEESKCDKYCAPRPVCRPDKCAVVKCDADHVCYDGRCILRNTTCVGFEECTDDQECYLLTITCIVAPCFPPYPACRSNCKNVTCTHPLVCLGGQCMSKATADSIREHENKMP